MHCIRLSSQFILDFLSRGGLRIPRRRGRQPGDGAQAYDFAKISKKLYEIKKILGRGAGG